MNDLLTLIDCSADIVVKVKYEDLLNTIVRSSQQNRLTGYTVCVLCIPAHAFIQNPAKITCSAAFAAPFDGVRIVLVTGADN